MAVTLAMAAAVRPSVQTRANRLVRRNGGVDRRRQGRVDAQTDFKPTAERVIDRAAPLDLLGAAHDSAACRMCRSARLAFRPLDHHSEGGDGDHVEHGDLGKPEIPISNTFA